MNNVIAVGRFVKQLFKTNLLEKFRPDYKKAETS